MQELKEPWPCLQWITFTVPEDKGDRLDTGSPKIGDETDVGEVGKVGQVPRLDIMSLFPHQRRRVRYGRIRIVEHE